MRQESGAGRREEARRRARPAEQHTGKPGLGMRRRVRSRLQEPVHHVDIDQPESPCRNARGRVPAIRNPSFSYSLTATLFVLTT